MPSSASSTSASISARARRLLGSRHLLTLAVVVAALLTAPSLFTGLHTEDFVQRALVRSGDYEIPWRVNLYGRAHRSLVDVEKRTFEYRVFGWFPWLTDDHFDVSFWRPASSLTHQVDYRAFPESPWLMHGLSVAWYAALILAVGLLFRRLVAPPWVAGLATLLYAVDDAHGHAVGWLANRNGVMASLFGVLALYFHDRWRRDGTTWASAVSALCLGLGLLSAEFALCAVGYLVAHAWFVDPRRGLARFFALAPSALVVGAWATAYRFLGHSAHGSGLYINPMSQPVAFLFELSERATVLLAAQLGGLPSNLWTWVSVDRQGLVVFAALVVVWFVVRTMTPVLEDDPRARFWALGTVLSLPPACAVFPEDRLLFFAGVGVMPLVAMFLSRCFGTGIRARDLRRAPVVLGLCLVVAHLCIAPALLPFRTLYMHRYHERLDRAASTLFRHVSATSDFLVVVNAEDLYFAGMMPLLRVAQGRPPVGRMLTLAGTLDAVVLERVDERTLRVAPKDGFLSKVLSRIYRARSSPMDRNSRVDLLGVDVLVSEVDQFGEPTEATFRFSTSLDDHRLRWVIWRDGEYRPFAPPKVGERLVVRGTG